MRWLKSFAQKYPHWRLFLYWPVFGLLFLLAERGNLSATYYQMHCALDDKIPFCELFLLPYLFWFVYLIGMHIYLFFTDGEEFTSFMRFIILTYSAGLIMFYLFPTCQTLRPAVFERDNILTQFMAGFYQFDTNTNVCPSLHVVGALAVTFAGLHNPRLKSFFWKFFFISQGILISISSVFVKQHSVMDVVAGLLISAGAWYLVYGRESIQELQHALRSNT